MHTNALLASQYILSAVTAVLDLFTLNSVMLVNILYCHWEKTIDILRQKVFIIILTRGLLWSSKCTRTKVSTHWVSLQHSPGLPSWI